MIIRLSVGYNVGYLGYPRLAKTQNTLQSGKIAHAPAKEKAYKLKDSNGLYVLVTPYRGRLWRYRYRFAGKIKDLALGIFPALTLAQARAKRDEARTQLMNGLDPAEVKKARKQLALQAADGPRAETFEVVAREFYEKFKDKWMPSTIKKTLSRLELNIFPWLGARPIKEIEPPELLAVLRRTESRRKLETTKRVRIDCNNIFKYAVSSGYAERNPAADIGGALPSPTPKPQN